MEDAKIDFTPLESSFADLPMEIIVSIFHYLQFADLQAAALSCRRWLEASLYPDFQSKIRLKFSKLCLSDKQPPASQFLQSERSFGNLYLEEVNFGGIEKFLPRLNNTLRSITFDSCDLNEKSLCYLLQDMKQLRSLTLTRCSPLFMTGRFVEVATDIHKIERTMSGLKALSLRENQYLTDDILLCLLSMTRSLEILDLSGCHIAYHNAIVHRFYPEDQCLPPSTAILSFKFVLRVVAAHRATLRELNLSDTFIGTDAIIALGQVKGGLHLECLKLRSCRQLTSEGIIGFLPNHSMLRQLDLSDTACVNDAFVECLVKSVPLLESINLKGCGKLTNVGASLLAKLTHLHYLNLSQCKGLSGDGLIQGIALAPNTVLRELHLSHINLCKDSIKLCAKNLTELRVLNLGNCVNGVTDESVQCIITHLCWLRELNLEDCFRITDAALTGINVEAQLNKQGSLSDINPLPSTSLAEGLSADLQPMKISLRSKAEDEIVRDANRKKALLDIYELNLIDATRENTFGISMQNLKGLQILNLKGCTKISDVSLKYGFKFLELRRLLLSNCQQISLTGIEALVQNCPSIEELDLSDCYNINDKTIDTLTNKLQRLRSLHISGCTQLTDHSLDSILSNCKVLQTLSVYRCRHMYNNIEERLTSMSSLRTLNMDHNTSLDNADLFRLKKRLDY